MPFRPGSPRPQPVREMPPVVLVRDYGWDAIAGAHAARELRRVGWGIYVPTTAADDLRSDALARIQGLHRRLKADHVFSHESAALLHGLPVWATPRVTHVYQGWRSGTHGDSCVVRRAGLVGLERAEIAGMPVTTIERTVVDCARTCPPLAGLVVADAGLRAGADRERLARVAHDLGGRQGAARARTVIRLADDGAESAQETATRFIMLAAGLPAPETQIAVPTRRGPRWGDLGWPLWRLLLEYDGVAKYTDRRDLLDEKERQDLIAEACWTTVRVGQRDVAQPSQLVSRVLRHAPAGLRLNPERQFLTPVAQLTTRAAA